MRVSLSEQQYTSLTFLYYVIVYDEITIQWIRYALYLPYASPH